MSFTSFTMRGCSFVCLLLVVDERNSAGLDSGSNLHVLTSFSMRAWSIVCLLVVVDERHTAGLDSGPNLHDLTTFPRFVVAGVFAGINR